MGQPVRIDEIGIVGGKTEAALSQIASAAADFDIVFDILLAL